MRILLISVLFVFAGCQTANLENAIGGGAQSVTTLAQTVKVACGAVNGECRAGAPLSTEQTLEIQAELRKAAVAIRSANTALDANDPAGAQDPLQYANAILALVRQILVENGVQP